MLLKNKKILYKDWIYTWLLEKKDYIKESTYANYSNNIFNHIIPKLGNYYLNELNHKVIQDFLLELSKNGRKDNNGGLAEKTIKDITIIIKGSIGASIDIGTQNFTHHDIIYITCERSCVSWEGQIRNMMKIIKRILLSL